MFFVSAEVGKSDEELFTDFCRSFTFKFRERGAGKKRRDGRFPDCLFSARFQERGFPKVARVRNEKEIPFFSSCAKVNEFFLDTNCAFSLGL